MAYDNVFGVLCGDLVDVSGVPVRSQGGVECSKASGSLGADSGSCFWNLEYRVDRIHRDRSDRRWYCQIRIQKSDVMRGGDGNGYH